jgi:prepilin-type N-terminal cleavage/methylation domain-containing protein
MNGISIRSEVRPSRERCGRTPDIARRAFTLFEMLLTLAVIALMALAGYPSVRKLMLERQVRQGAEMVGVKLGSTRVHAIEHAVPYQFRFEPDGRRYIACSAEANPAAAGAQMVSSTGATAVVRWRAIGSLPRGVTFATVNSPVRYSGPPVPPIDADDIVGLPGAEEFDSVRWSEPIVFQPDGSGTTAAIEVRGPGNYVYRIHIRGLTGGVRVQSQRNER